MKIFSAKQSAVIDRYTVEHEPVSEEDLIARASERLADWLSEHFGRGSEILFFAGSGNNGKDAAVTATMMSKRGYRSSVHKVSQMRSVEDIPPIPPESIIVDGLFGSGLSRKIDDELLTALIYAINHSGAKVVSIDIPSGLFMEDNRDNDLQNIVRADWTLTFQFPKLAMFFPENFQFTGDWQVLPIGLHEDIIAELYTPYFSIDKSDITDLLVRRKKFSHKGDYGHALLIAGSYGMGGAAILSGRAAMRSGAGLLTAHIPEKLYSIVQVAVPEAICRIDPSASCFSEAGDISGFNAIGVGPGLGMSGSTKQGVKNLLLKKPDRMVIDADALNILSADRDILSLLPAGAILTPHPKEFERLAGVSADSYQRLAKQIEFSKRHGVIIVLKGAHTSVSTPDGKVYFNMTGNPGMSTAGSGDVLTGVILGLLSQGCTPEQAAIAGVYLHGLCGDLAAKEKGENSLLAGDLVDYLGAAFLYCTR